MSLQHSIYLFDYQAFQDVVALLDLNTDHEGGESLLEQVLEIKQTLPEPSQWILHDKGTFLNSYSSSDPYLQNAQLGHLFLILLSSFLKETIPLGYDWQKLYYVLRSFGWDEEDIWQVLVGLPTALLFKPDISYHKRMVIKSNDPYWYWVRPERATYNGWLSKKEIVRLSNRLISDYKFIESKRYELIQLPTNVSLANAHISKELDPNYWYLRIPFVYQTAIDVMQQALKLGQGLYMVVYEEEGSQNN